MLGYHRTNRADIMIHEVNLGSGLIVALQRVSEKLFTYGITAEAEEEPWQFTCEQQQMRGEFIYLVSQGMRILQTMRMGSQQLQQLKFAYLNSQNVDRWILWCKAKQGDTCDAIRIRKRKEEQDVNQ